MEVVGLAIDVGDGNLGGAGGGSKRPGRGSPGGGGGWVHFLLTTLKLALEFKPIPGGPQNSPSQEASAHRQEDFHAGVIIAFLLRSRPSGLISSSALWTNSAFTGTPFMGIP